MIYLSFSETCQGEILTPNIVQYCEVSPCAAKIALTCQDMDLRPLRLSCGRSGSSVPICCRTEPPWIRPAPARLTDAPSDWDSSSCS